VGTSWGAQQYRRARQIAWTGIVTIAVPKPNAMGCMTYSSLRDISASISAR
jgi:hypothetical protein